MPAFRYVAIAPNGALIRGEMDVADTAAVIARLRQQGNLPIGAEPARRGLGGALEMPWRKSGLQRQELAELTRELGVMLNAGQDLDRALRFLVETATRPRVVRVLNALRDSVRDGTPFASAMVQHPTSFPKLYVGLVRAGEAGGVLAPTLERLATLLERERALASTVSSALIYPLVLLVAAVGSIVLLLTSVLPQFVPLFQESGAALPVSTRFMIASGEAIGRWGLPALAVLAATGLAAARLMHRSGVRLFVDRMRLQLPIVGTLAREVMAARLTRTLGTLLTSGMPLIAALDVSRDTLGNAAGVAALDKAAAEARGGAGLARPLAASGLFPVRTIHLLQLGEETAELGAMALRAAEIHEERTRLVVQRLVSLLTPAITIGMGGLIALIVGSLLQAMLGLNDLAH